MGWVVRVTPRPLFTPRKYPVPIVQDAGWAPGPFWTVAENLTPTGIRSPDRPARSQSLYRLSYRAHVKNNTSFRRMDICLHVTRQVPCLLFWDRLMGQDSVIVMKRRSITINKLQLILGSDQLNTQFLYFTIRLLWSSTCFEHYTMYAHHQEVEFYWCSIRYRHSQ